MFKFIIFPGILLKIFKTRLLIIIKEINQNSRGKYFLSLLTTLQQPEELLSACIHDNRCDQSDLGHQSWSSWSPTFSDSHVTTAIFLYTLHCQSWWVKTCRTSRVMDGHDSSMDPSLFTSLSCWVSVLVTFAYFECIFFFF